MPFYGSVLWDLSCTDINMFYTAWRKCIRRILNISSRTHCRYLNTLCADFPVDMQLHTRFLKFFHMTLSSNNDCISLCAKLALNGSGSIICQNLNLVSYIYSINKYQIKIPHVNQIIENIHRLNMNNIPHEDFVNTSVINDLLHMREYPDLSLFTSVELNSILENMCVN